MIDGLLLVCCAMLLLFVIIENDGRRLGPPNATAV